MIDQTKIDFTSPVAQEVERNRDSKTFHYFLFTFGIVLVFRLLLSSVNPAFNISFVFFAAAMLLLLSLYVASHKGYFFQAALILPYSMTLRAILLSLPDVENYFFDIGYGNFILPITLSGLLLGRKHLVIISSVSILSMCVIYLGEMAGLIPFGDNRMLAGELFEHIVILSTATLFFLEYDKRQQIDKQLLQTNSMMELVLNNIPQAVFWKDRNSRFLGGNRVFAESAGYENPLDIVGLTDYDMPWKKSESDFFVEYDQKVIESGKPEFHIIEPKHLANGEKIWLDTNKIPLKDASGHIIGLLGTYENISQRVRTEKEVEKSEEKYRTLVENINIGLFRSPYSFSSNLEHVNIELAKMLGYDSEKALLKIKIESIFESKKEFINLTRALDNNGVIHHREVHLKKLDGSYLWGEITARCITDKKNDTQWIDGVLIDRTKKKLTEIALKETEDRLRAISNTIPIIIWSANEDGIFVLSEGKALGALGLKPGEIVGQSAYVLYAKYPDIIANLDRALKGETFLAKSDVEDLVFETYYSPIIKNSEIVGINGISFDITPRIRAEEAQSESEKNYEDLFNHVNDAILILDPADETILVANKKAASLYNLKIKELVGHSLKEFTLEKEKGSEKIKLIISGEDLKNYESLHVDKDGNKLDLLINASLIKFKGKDAILTINREVTERKRMQEQIYRANKLESMGKLAGTVAHDLNHVLSGLVTYPDLLLQTIDPENPLKPKITTIKESGLRAAAIVNDLMNFARGTLTKPEVVDINKIVSNCLKSPELLQIKEDHSKIDFSIELGKKVNTVLCSKVKIEKMFYNLLVNGCESMPDGGEMTISTRRVLLKKPRKAYEDILPGNYTTFTISDSGFGINANDINNIFDAYFSKKETGRSGTGLGLTIVWNIVKEYNGFIDVVSKPGKGTTFCVYFPEHIDNTEKIEPSQKATFGNGETVLVIDDELSQRELSEKILLSLNYTAVTRETGDAGIEYIRNNKVDLVLLDMILGSDMDGLETYIEIKKINPDLKVLIISGYSASERIKNAITLGAKGFLSKPFTIKELGSLMHNTLQKE